MPPHHEEHQFVLFVQPKDPEIETWHGYRVGVEAAKEQYGADEVYPITELDEHLPKYLANADRIYYRLGRDRNFNQKILDHWQRLLAQYPKEGVGPIALEDPSPILSPLRLTKSEAELALMRKAVDISVEAHLLARELAKPGRYEYEIQAEMERLFRLHGGLGSRLSNHCCVWLQCLHSPLHREYPADASARLAPDRCGLQLRLLQR